MSRTAPFNQIALGENSRGHIIHKCLYPSGVAQIRMGENPYFTAKLWRSGWKAAEGWLSVANKTRQHAYAHTCLDGFELEHAIIEPMADGNGRKRAVFDPPRIGDHIFPADPIEAGKVSRVSQVSQIGLDLMLSQIVAGGISCAGMSKQAASDQVLRRIICHSDRDIGFALGEVQLLVRYNHFEFYI